MLTEKKQLIYCFVFFVFLTQSRVWHHLIQQRGTCHCATSIINWLGCSHKYLPYSAKPIFGVTACVLACSSDPNLKCKHLHGELTSLTTQNLIVYKWIHYGFIIDYIYSDKATIITHTYPYNMKFVKFQLQVKSFVPLRATVSCAGH